MVIRTAQAWFRPTPIRAMQTVMAITYDYSADDGILYARASGVITPADSEVSHRTVAEYRERHAGMKLLTDMREADVDGTPAQMLAIMEAFYRIVGPGLPVAILVRREPDDPNPMLAETRAFIEGARMQRFHDEAEAIAWLKAQD